MGSSTSSVSIKILLISTGIVSVAMAMNSLIPSILNFAINDIPIIWLVILSWLKPPYLYVVINGIIITIAASSRFHHHYYHNNDGDDHHQYSHAPILVTFNVTNSIIIDPPQPVLVHEDDELVAVRYDAFDHENINGHAKEKEVYDHEITVDVETVSNYEVVANKSEDKFAINTSGSSWNPAQRLISPPAEIIQKEFIPLLREKPLVSSRFANQRRTTKINPEGVRSLRVAKPTKNETLESTWKAITDGRHMPLNRHLKKSDTFENHHHHHRMKAHPEELTPGVVNYNNNVMKTSQTFNDRTDSSRNHRVLASRTTALRKEGSLSQDDLNRRVEAFIKKFNDDMRLQREESLKRYMDMINRGA